MATRDWAINRDSNVLSPDRGNTLDDHHPVGLSTGGGLLFRAFLRFTMDFSDMITITDAKLWMRSTSEVHTGRGSSPTIRVKKLTETLNNTVGGSGENSWSTSANPDWGNQPNSTTTDQSAATNMVDADNTWDSVDITAMAQAWLAGGTHYGVLVKAENEGSTADTWEFYSQDSAYNPYIRVTYTTNTVPDAPTGVMLESSPSGSILNNADNLWWLNFDGNDETGDTLVSYDYQIDATTGNGVSPDWVSPIADVSNATAGIFDPTEPGQGVATTITHALSRNQWYGLRVRTNDGTGDGTWSATYYFKTAQLPTATLTEPSATGRLGKLSYTAGSGWASPRLNTAWTFSCPDGGTQSYYEVEVNNDTAGSPGSSLYDSGTVAGTATSLVIPATLTEAAYYHVRVKVTCSHGEVSAFTSYFRIRTRWGATMHERDLGSAPTSWSVSTLTTTTGASSAVTVEYNSSADGTTTPDAWRSSLSAVTLRRYMRYRVWLMAWGSSPATSPSLDRLVLSYTATVLVPDKWTREDATNSYASEATYVYGTQSLQHAGDGGNMNTYQEVTVTPDTDYILSARIKSSGNSGAKIILATAGTSGALVETSAIVATADWERYSTAVWNSGSNTSVFIRCFSNGAAATAAWFDAVKMEASRVVTPWVPGFVGSAVVLDAGGLQIDGVGGGIFRLRGSNGGARDRVDLSTRGLQFGGPTNGAHVYSDVADVLKVGAAGVHLNAADGSIAGKKPIVTVYTVVGGNTWTKPANLSHIEVFCIGAGGGGGGTAATAAGQAAASAGGGGGGFAYKKFDVSALTQATYTATVGDSGAGASAGNNTGSAGTASTFAGTGITTVSGGGGGGGTGEGSTSGSANSPGGAGGTSSGGDVNVTGSDGGDGRVVTGIFVHTGVGGAAAGPFGGGGVAASVNATGSAGKNYGGGGSGVGAGASQSAFGGGTAANGIIIIIEHFAP